MPIDSALDHIGFSVTPETLDDTIAFYADTFGFGVHRRFDSHGMTFVFLTNASTKLELMASASARRSEQTDVFSTMDPARLHHLCFSVADLDATLATLGDAGVAPIGGPMEIPEIGQRIAFVTDNLGNVIELTEPSTAAA